MSRKKYGATENRFVSIAAMTNRFSPQVLEQEIFEPARQMLLQAISATGRGVLGPTGNIFSAAVGLGLGCHCSEMEKMSQIASLKLFQSDVESICQTTWNRRLIFPSPNNQCDGFPCSLSYAYCNRCIHGRCIGDCFQANASTQCLGFHVWLSHSFLDEQQSKRICCMESFATSSRGDLSLNWLQQKNAKDR